MKVATHRSKHPKIEWVRDPGLSRDPMHRLQKTYLKGKGGPLVVIGLKGGRVAGELPRQNRPIENLHFLKESQGFREVGGVPNGPGPGP